MYVIPCRPEVEVFDPELKDFIPRTGREVSPGPYWMRRIQDGDAKEGKPPVPTSPRAPDETVV